MKMEEIALQLLYCNKSRRKSVTLPYIKVPRRNVQMQFEIVGLLVIGFQNVRNSFVFLVS